MTHSQTFLQRYHAEHLPLIADVPGLRSMIVERVAATLRPTSDLVLTNHMTFDRPRGAGCRHGQRRRCVVPGETCARSRPDC